GRDVLDVCCCDGGFSLACLRGGAKSVLALDSSAAALDAFAANLAANGFAGDARCGVLRADAFTQLRSFRDSRRSFDLIVLDPPKLAETKQRAAKACRAYKDLNLLAFKLLRPGGLLATFSCSGAVDPALFRTVVAEAALDAGRDARAAGTFSQGPDHPVALSFPEGLYLKGLLCSVS
ncbi:MAG: RsmD family RNA methyltransferase, partial [Kiritimatiellae bacterium]|nr:RsmD family RNA methyltransferase [Kiritimatiellia bacterium]